MQLLPQIHHYLPLYVFVLTGTRSQSFDLHKPSSPECTVGSQSLPISSEYLKVPDLQHSRSLSNPMPLIRELAVDCEDRENEEEIRIEEVDMGETESKLDRGSSRYRSSTDIEQVESSLDFDIIRYHYILSVTRQYLLLLLISDSHFHFCITAV